MTGITPSLGEVTRDAACLGVKTLGNARQQNLSTASAHGEPITLTGWLQGDVGVFWGATRFGEAAPIRQWLFCEKLSAIKPRGVVVVRNKVAAVSQPPKMAHPAIAPENTK